MFKFLPGIILIQLVTAGLVYAAILQSEQRQLVVVIIFLSFLVSILASFWFSAIARDMHKEEIIRIQEQHARDREKLLVNAEREKADIATASYQKIEKETRKVHARANFKVGAAFAAAMGAGGLMIFTQLVTVGVMILIASGSGLAGYLMRARQERLSKRKQLAANESNLITINEPSPKQLHKD